MADTSMRDEEFPNLDPRKIEAVENVIHGFKNLVSTRGFSDNHTQILFIHNRSWFTGEALVAQVKLSSITDHRIDIEKPLNDSKAEQILREGFQRHSKGFANFFTGFVLPNGMVSTPIHHHYCTYNISIQSDDDNHAPFLQTLERALKVIGGKKKPEQRPGLKL